MDTRSAAPRKTTRPTRLMRRVAVAVALLMVVLAAMFASYHASKRHAFAQIDDAAIHQLDLYASTLESELARHAWLPGLLEVDRDIASLFDGDRRREARDAASKKLAGFNVMAGSMAIFLLDPQGAVLASSDAYRSAAPNEARASPLFLTHALKEGRTGFFAAEAQRGAAGYYFAQPVMRDTRLAGLIGVHISLDPMEATWVDMGVRSESEVILVIDEMGVVIMASVPAWKYRSVVALTGVQREALQASGRYPPHSLAPLGLRLVQPIERGAKLVEPPAWKGASPSSPRIAQERPLPQLGWRLMILSDPSEAVRDAVYAAWGGAAVAGFACLLVLYLMQRRRAMRQLFAARNALQQANDTLEATVVERTRELRAANQTLVGEMQERQRTEQSLIQAGKLAVLGQMSVGIAHEVNQPLTALRALSTNTATLLDKGRMPEALANLKAIGDVVARMGRITAQLKSFARKSQASHAAVSLNTAVSNVCLLLEHRISAEQVQLRVDIPDGVLVECDSNRLEQVLINLATNAIDAMAGSALKLLFIGARVSGGRALLRVSDSGPQVSDEVRQRLFEPFFSTKPAGEGLGLGLVISSSIVREFGGELKVAKAESGLAFEFDLPLSSKGTADV